MQSVVSELVTIMTVRVMHDHIMDVSTKWILGPLLFETLQDEGSLPKKIEALFEVSL